MDYTKLIHDFMDGTLEGTEEEQMFFQFSSNDELRAELKQQIAIRDAIRNDTRAFTPTANSTVGVFSALGFNPPSTVVDSILPAGNAAKPGFFTKYRQGFISAAVSIVGTAALFLLLMNPFGEKNTAQTNNNKQSYAQTQTLPESMPNVQSFSNDVPKTEVRYITKVRYIDVPRYVDLQPVQSISDNSVTSIADNETASSDLTSADLDSHSNSEFSMINNSNKIPELGYETKNDFLNNLNFSNDQLGLSMELRGSMYWNLKKETINPYQFNKFNNSALALYYNMNDNFAFGAEVRQETFFQKYTSLNDDSTFEQQPNFTTYGINLRYSAPYDYLGISPFGQLSGGFNKAGIVYRGMLGLKYSPYYNITFTVGGEYSGFRYYHNNKGFVDSKIGLNYGVMFNF
ncbi:MAG: hypothetical protein HZB41_03510 [Ignavibacteriae bacterium]|nr:hypothetical protein [Ignavibacteriota bacterium]